MEADIAEFRSDINCLISVEHLFLWSHKGQVRWTS